MIKKSYNAGLVSKGFWFYEIKQYIELLNNGKSDQEIKLLSSEINIFGAVSESRAKEILNGTKRRVKVLGSEIQTLFPQLDINNQKIIVLISVLLENDLFMEFMLEVFQSKIQKNDLILSQKDYYSFFSEKQRTNEIVSGWTSYTYKRLGNAYKNYLKEAGLIRLEKNIDIIMPKILDQRVLYWLKSIDRLDVAKAISGRQY